MQYERDIFKLKTGRVARFAVTGLLPNSNFKQIEYKIKGELKIMLRKILWLSLIFGIQINTENLENKKDVQDQSRQVDIGNVKDSFLSVGAFFLKVALAILKAADYPKPSI